MNTIRKILILSLIALSAVASHAMHNPQIDTKGTNEHNDKTEADRVATLKAKAHANKETPDEDGLLGALGNPESESLRKLVVADAAMHKERKKAAQAKRTIEKSEFLGMSLFDRLPEALKTKIVFEYYDKAIPSYVLRHKRELAPILFIRPAVDARDILDSVDNSIASVKTDINDILRTHLRLNPTHPDHPYNQPVIFALGWFYGIESHNTASSYRIPRVEVVYGHMQIAGYNDRTYNIYFNSTQLKELMDSYSLEQLMFFVSLAKIPVSRTIAGTSLSSKDCEIFVSLDAPMQAKLKRLYWWIDFYTPNDCALSIDDKIEWAQNKILAHGAYWLQWATVRLPYLCKNAHK